MASRREFLTALGAFAGAAACSRGASAMDSASALRLNSRRLDRIGIQLYTVRADMRRDMPATLAQIAGIGYREVEFAGYVGRTPREVRELLERNRLTSPSTHVSIEAARLDKTLDEAAEIGHRWVTVPSLPRASSDSADAYRRTADEFNRIGERAKARGLRLAFHNHDAELRRMGDAVPYDLLVEGTDPALVDFQMDVFWLVKGGGDPIAYLRKHPTRFTMLHVKDSAGPPDHKQVDVGAGTIDFAAILKLDAAQRGVIRHAFIEHDTPADPMTFAKVSFDYLSKLEY
jgi:sugar phosphate isomerase/epimerase